MARSWRSVHPLSSTAGALDGFAIYPYIPRQGRTSCWPEPYRGSATVTGASRTHQHGRPRDGDRRSEGGGRVLAGPPHPQVADDHVPLRHQHRVLGAGTDLTDPLSPGPTRSTTSSRAKVSSTTAARRDGSAAKTRSSSRPVKSTKSRPSHRWSSTGCRR